MNIEMKRYGFTRPLGWSISRYDLFKRCKRAYYFNYYGKYSPVPFEKIKFLKSLTSVPLEKGNVIHHIFEQFLKRLKISQEEINTDKFLHHGELLCEELFTEKTFMETYYDNIAIDIPNAAENIRAMLRQFLDSSLYAWIIDAAHTDASQWIIEPGGFGETRLKGIKAYCKMDFLLPVGGKVYILDWKTGKKQIKKHTTQLLAYSAAILSENPHLNLENIRPQIVYIQPDSLEILSTELFEAELEQLYEKVREETEEMQNYCSNTAENIPRDMEVFPRCDNPKICAFCPFREICIDEKPHLPF
ncbi:MAG: RecB family exonuclease [Fibrobacterota bacterium]